MHPDQCVKQPPLFRPPSQYPFSIVEDELVDFLHCEQARHAPLANLSAFDTSQTISPSLYDLHLLGGPSLSNEHDTHLDLLTLSGPVQSFVPVVQKGGFPSDNNHPQVRQDSLVTPGTNSASLAEQTLTSRADKSVTENIDDYDPDSAVHSLLDELESAGVFQSSNSGSQSESSSGVDLESENNSASVSDVPSDYTPDEAPSHNNLNTQQDRERSTDVESDDKKRASRPSQRLEPSTVIKSPFAGKISSETSPSQECKTCKRKQRLPTRTKQDDPNFSGATFSLRLQCSGRARRPAPYRLHGELSFVNLSPGGALTYTTRKSLRTKPGWKNYDESRFRQLEAAEAALALVEASRGQETSSSRARPTQWYHSRYTQPLAQPPLKPTQPAATLSSLCPQKDRQVIFSGQRNCASCRTSRTPLWRDAEDGTPLCNACGIRYKKYRVRCQKCFYIPRKEEKASNVCQCGGRFISTRRSSH